METKELLEKLKDQDPDVRLSALNFIFFDMLAEGKDVPSDLFPDIINCLGGEDDLNHQAVMILNSLTLNDEIYPYLAEAQVDISSLIDKWKKDLDAVEQDPGNIFGSKVFEKLKNAAKHGIDISPVLEKLKVFSFNKDSDHVENASKALCYHYFNTDHWRGVVDLLELAHIRLYALHSIKYAVKKGKDISPILRDLEFIMRWEPGINAFEKSLPGQVLTHHYLNKNEHEKIAQFLESDSSSKIGAVCACTYHGIVNGYWDTVKEFLESDNEYVVSFAAVAFEEALDEEKDISPAVPALANALDNGPEDSRFSILKILYLASEKGVDISDAFPSLLRAVTAFSVSPLNRSSIRFLYEAMNKIVKREFAKKKDIPEVKGMVDEVLKKEKDPAKIMKLKRIFSELYRNAFSSLITNPLQGDGIRLKEIPKKKGERFRTGVRRRLPR